MASTSGSQYQPSKPNNMCSSKAKTKLIAMNFGLAGKSKGRPAGMIMV
jgi:hypothetical protein